MTKLLFSVAGACFIRFFLDEHCTEILSTKKTNAEATKLVVESIVNNRGLNTLTIMDKYESTQLSPSYLVGMSSSSMPMTGVPEAGVLMVLLIICWIFLENSLSPSTYPILRELESAVCNPMSRTATRGEEVWLGARLAAARITPHCAGAAAWRRGS